MSIPSKKRLLTVWLARPQGPCAGVDRAIRTVEDALAQFGPPVYVRHAIVHNDRVTADLEARGVVFIEDLLECPNHRPVILSAQGVAPAVVAEAEQHGMTRIDATCPMVAKVHSQVRRAGAGAREVILFGHRSHQEVWGKLAHAGEPEIHVVSRLAHVTELRPRDLDHLAYATQTTVSVDETEYIVAALGARFPGIQGPRRKDICYATTNRQEAVKRLADRAGEMLVIGSASSSKTARLIEKANGAGPQPGASTGLQTFPGRRWTTSRLSG